MSSEPDLELTERARKLFAGPIEFLKSAPELKFLPDPDVPEIIPRLDPLRLTERRIVEIHPRGVLLSVRQGHVRLRAHVQTMVSITRSVAFDFIERG